MVLAPFRLCIINTLLKVQGCLGSNSRRHRHTVHHCMAARVSKAHRCLNEDHIQTLHSCVVVRLAFIQCQKTSCSTSAHSHLQQTARAHSPPLHGSSNCQNACLSHVETLYCHVMVRIAFIQCQNALCRGPVTSRPKCHDSRSTHSSTAWLLANPRRMAGSVPPCTLHSCVMVRNFVMQGLMRTTEQAHA